MPGSENDSAEKKHKPTRKRLRKAREQGDVPKSQDLTSAVVLIAWIVALCVGAPPLGRAWERRADAVLLSLSHPTTQVLAQDLRDCATLTFVSVVALMIPVASIGLLAQFAQVGPILAFSKVAPDLARLNPIKWVERLFKWETTVELLKALVKQTVVLIVSYGVFANRLPSIFQGANGDPGEILHMLADNLLRLFAMVAAIAVGLGLIDLPYQRILFLWNMRMNVTDFKRDRREMEGDPKIKRRRRQLYREWANHNAAEATRGAVVVITNPTHYAVALAYDPSEHTAPVVAAKGQDDLAAHIRLAAEDAGVPIIRNPPLARELHDRIEIDENVPEDLFTAVAEVIVWASRLRRKDEAQEELNSE